MAQIGSEPGDASVCGGYFWVAALEAAARRRTKTDAQHLLSRVHST